MGVKRYKGRSGTFWMVDAWLTLPNGQVVRFRQRKIPTREAAMALLAKRRTEAFEDRFFDRPKVSRLTVEDAWDAYQPISKRDNDTWQTEKGRAKHLLRHLGDKLYELLTLQDIDSYRTRRLGETTRRKKPPAPATLDLEVELLKRIGNYAVDCGKLKANPLGRVKLLRKPNVRRSVIDEAQFGKLYAAAEPELQPMLVVGFDTGMRLEEILSLKWSQVHLKESNVKLAAEDTKTDEPRTIFLTGRAMEVFKHTPRHISNLHVFINPKTGERWQDIRKMFHRACKAAGLEGLWFHDLRRSFITNARRYGVPESVVMRMSGHKTRSVFDRYNIIEEDDLREAVKRIDAAAAKNSDESFRQDLDKVPEGGGTE